MDPGPGAGRAGGGAGEAAPAGAGAAQRVRGGIVSEPPECFSHGTATFMVMGDLCTRRCPFCNVAHGRPNPLEPTSGASGGGDRGAGAALRGDHLGRSRRSPRRRRGPFRGLRAGGARRESRHPDRDPRPRLPRADGRGAGAPRRGASRRLQPQTSRRCAAVPQGPAPAPTTSGRSISWSGSRPGIPRCPPSRG